jgi:RNA polymerase subunit RPABC4/transcription elongation factor Spt4
MVVDILKDAINLIRAGKNADARRILEPYIIANPHNIEAWLWETEAREDIASKLKILGMCLSQNPGEPLVIKVLAALKTRQEILVTTEVQPTIPPQESSLQDLPVAAEVQPTIPPPETSLQDLPVAAEVQPTIPPQEPSLQDVPVAAEVQSIIPPQESSPQDLPDTHAEKTEVIPDYISAPKLKPCPYCAEMIQEQAKFCRFCSHELIPSIEEQKPCPYCGEIIQEQAKFCRFCSHELIPSTEKQKPCPYCGESIREQANFCRFCNHELIPSTEKQKPCPYCAEMVQEKAKYCRFCGRNLVPVVEQQAATPKPTLTRQKKKKWYRETWVKILAFIFFMPLWIWIVLSDPESTKAAKTTATVLLVLYIVLCFLFLYLIIMTTATHTNILDWYHNLVGDGAAGEVVNVATVKGIVENIGKTALDHVEIQAKVYNQAGKILGNNSSNISSAELLPGSPSSFQIIISAPLASVGSIPSDPNVLFSDDFSNSSSGWDKSTKDNGTTDYNNNKYYIQVNNADYDLWANPGKSYPDTKIEVDATKLDGPENNRFGIQCRYADADNYYFAFIASDGYYGIGKVVDSTQMLFYENGMRATDKVKAGSGTNHIRFDCVGTKLSLYINGDFVDAKDDSDLTSGDVGLIAGTFDEIGTKIAFDNFVVYKP